jgi:putative intracellular protease/amidase
MTRIAYLVTSAREMTLADGTAHPTGYFAEEALKPYERFTDAGFDVTVITPDGNPPYADPYGLSWFFQPRRLSRHAKEYQHDHDTHADRAGVPGCIRPARRRRRHRRG